jgi:hypothetical protein
MAFSMLVSSMYPDRHMKTTRKITVEVPLELLKKAQEATGAGVTQTVHTGLQLVAASGTYTRLPNSEARFDFRGRPQS